ncbi:MAG: amino acid adenylation domain-containing protein, partial [Bacteroidota bacterium]
MSSERSSLFKKPNAFELTGLHLAQQDVYFDQIIDPSNPAYNIGGYIQLRGQLNRDCFLQAIQYLPEAFDLFGMRFDCSGAEPQCSFGHPPLRIPVLEEDFSAFTDPHRSALQWIQDRFQIVFDIANNEFLELGLLKIKEDVHYMLFRYHHIFIDGHGIAILHHCIANKYTALLGLNSSDQSKPFPSYQAAIQKSIDYLHSNQYDIDAAYWKSKFDEVPQALLQPIAQMSPKVAVGKRLSFQLSSQQRKTIEDTAQQATCSVQQLLLAATSIYFSRVEKREAIVIGVPLHKRRGRQEKQTAGMFSGVIPFKTQMQKGESLQELINRIKQQQRQDYRHLSYPISHLNRSLNLMAKGRQQLFDVNVIFDLLDFHYNLGEVENNSRQLTVNDGEVPLEIRWCAYKAGDELELNIDYSSRYFHEEDIQLFGARFLYLLEQCATKLNAPIETIDLLTPSEREKVLHTFNATEASYAAHLTFVDLFQGKAKQFAEQTAVVYEDQALTYQELDQQSNQLAHFLLAKGVQPNDLVAIALDRSVEIVVAILAVFKAGAAYVPIDPAYPSDRIQFLIEDSQANLLISQAKLNIQVKPKRQLTTILIDRDGTSIAGCNEEGSPVQVKAQDIAYVIYTSGSTGKPKGVVIKHHSLVNVAEAWIKEYDLDETTSILQMASFSFDVSIGDLCRSLLCGGRMTIASQDSRFDPAQLYQIIKAQQVNLMDITPAMAIPLMAYIEKYQLDISWMKVLIIGADVFPVADFQHIIDQFGGQMRILNSYGTTETTIDNCYFENYDREALRYLSQVPIGRPLQNNFFYVLDEAQQIQPIGVLGELYIGGVGLAKSYLNRPALTKARFVPNPFRQGEKMYRTGDLARWLPSGDIDFLGRIDHQVKVSGYRIELGEIETILQQAPAVDQAVVLAKATNTGEKRLVAYIVAPEPQDEKAIQNYLKAHLPAYMVPGLMIFLDQMPLTPNAKIDRKALPNPDLGQLMASQYQAPRTRLENQMTHLWSQILKVDKIGIQDNFFVLGGHSLLAAQLVADIRQIFEQELSVADLFDHPTIEQLVQKIESNHLKNQDWMPLQKQVRPA